MSITKIPKDISSAWDDEVGSSISRLVKDTATRLQRSAEEYEKAHKGGESAIKSLPRYVGKGSEISSLRMDF